MKPENLMLVGDPVAPGGERVKVLDFGIAKLTDDRGGVKTATDQVMGTPAYMSPEQCAGAGGVDAQTDVYALGCVLYELLAGRTPFVADGPGRLIGMHLFQEPPTLLSVAPQVPTEIAELVHRMLRKEKTQRPTMKETARELARHLSNQTGGTFAARLKVEPIADADETRVIPKVSQVSTIGRSIGQSVKQPTRTKSGLALWGGAGVLAMVVATALWVSTRPESPPTVKPPVLATPPSSAETVEPKREQLDLGASPHVSTGESPSGESKPALVTPPALAAKPKTPAVAKVAPSVQPARPVNKTSPKKRFGYEE